MQSYLVPQGVFAQIAVLLLFLRAKLHVGRIGENNVIGEVIDVDY